MGRPWTTVPFLEAPPPEPASVPFVKTPPPSAETRLFLALPSYNGWVKGNCIGGAAFATQQGQIFVEVGCASILTVNFNQLWTKALNSRREGRWTHFAMMHADISAPPGWADVLIAEMNRTGVDMISAASPIKDHRRLSSHGAVQQDGSIRRLTMKEIHRLPVTFTTDDLPRVGIEGPLVVNTGLWVCRFDQPWVEQVWFHINNGIERMPDGTFKAAMLPEDWFFSRLLTQKGVRIAGTRVCRVGHWGEVEFTNEPDASGCEVDPGD